MKILCLHGNGTNAHVSHENYLDEYLYAKRVETDLVPKDHEISDW